MLNENVRSIQPEGFALVILVVSVLCLVASSLSIGLRTYIRWIERTFGPDDGLIIAGLVLYAVDVGLACHGTTVGLGTRSEHLNAWLTSEGLKYLMIWMMVYILSLAVIKGSICVTLYRIGYTNTKYRIAIFMLLGLIVATMLVTLIGVLVLCRPVSANWTGQGQCAEASSIIALSYTSTASTIITDLSLVVLPGIMVWTSIMDPRQKLFVCMLLSFGSIASIATMIRAPYIQHYWHPNDNLNYWTGYILLLSNLESAIGCIASSVPALRRLRQGRRAVTGRWSAPEAGRPKSLVTFGSLPVRTYSSAKLFRNPTDQGVSYATVEAGHRHWNRLWDGTEARDSINARGDDDEADVHGIRAEYTYEVELTHIKSYPV